MNTLEAKLLAITAISIGTYVCGFIPAVLELGSRCKESIFLSSNLCFGAGVLLATSVVHILPEVRNDIHQWGEITLCCGFFLIYLIDVILSSFHPHRRSSSFEEDLLLPHDNGRHYGAIGDESDPSISYPETSLEAQVSCMNFGLLVAVTIHALLEGLVIGIQDSVPGVWLLLGAVCSHKLLVAFSLGAELISGGRPWRVLIYPLSVFVLGSGFGIIFGMIFEVVNSLTIKAAIPYIEGIAGGTLLYVALCEIVPREKNRKLPAYAGLFQIVGMFSGFSVMSALSILI